jgi:hypothetical protein
MREHNAQNKNNTEQQRPSFLQLDNSHLQKETCFQNHDILVKGTENPDLIHSKHSYSYRA